MPSRPARGRAFGVHSLAVDVIAELGADIAGARSKSAEEFRDTEFDVVVTVCDSAAQDCPVWPNATRIEHWSIEDPSFEPDPESATSGSSKPGTTCAGESMIWSRR